MLIYDIHSHLGKTSSGDENSPEKLVNDLKAYGIQKVGISSLSGISTREQNDLVYRAMKSFPDIIKGYALSIPRRRMPLTRLTAAWEIIRWTGLSSIHGNTDTIRIIRRL